MTSTLIPIKRDTDRRLKGSAAGSVNIGDTERWLSLAGGGLLALGGIERRGITGLSLAALGTCLLYRGLSGNCSLYRALNIGTVKHSAGAAVAAGHGIRVDRATTINRSAEELYRHWRNFENLPSYMSHLASVKVNGSHSHWIARAPAGTTVEWDAEIINEEPNRLIAWRSLEGSQVSTAGSVHFSPLTGERGTAVRVSLKYDPPGGALGSWLAWLFGEEPEVQVREDLRAFKQIMEAGEVPAVSRPTSVQRSRT